MASAALLSSATSHHGGPPQVAESTLRWPFARWALPGWWLGWCFGWWQVSLRSLAHVATLGSTFALAAPWGAALAVGARLFALLAETAFYAAFWRVRGARLPFWRYSFHVMLGSFIDLQALELVMTHPVGDAFAPWLVVLAGPAAAPHRFALAHPVACGAFAGLGVLTLVRLGWVAWAQAEATRRRWRVPLMLTVTLWLITHLGLAAGLALVQGRSAVR